MQNLSRTRNSFLPDRSRYRLASVPDLRDTWQETHGYAILVAQGPADAVSRRRAAGGCEKIALRGGARILEDWSSGDARSDRRERGRCRRDRHRPPRAPRARAAV